MADVATLPPPLLQTFLATHNFRAQEPNSHGHPEGEGEVAVASFPFFVTLLASFSGQVDGHHEAPVGGRPARYGPQQVTKHA